MRGSDCLCYLFSLLAALSDGCLLPRLSVLSALSAIYCLCQLLSEGLFLRCPKSYPKPSTHDFVSFVRNHYKRIVVVLVVLVSIHCGVDGLAKVHNSAQQNPTDCHH